MTQDKVKQLVKDLIDRRMHDSVNWLRYKQDLVDITVDIVELAEMIEAHVTEHSQNEMERKRGED